MIITAKVLQRDEWLVLSKDAHVATFGVERPSHLERFHFALMALDENGTPGGWVTCHEMDSETVYWQYGGVLPNYELTPYMFRGYSVLIEWCKNKYKRIVTKIENKNIVMLKLAMKVGFIVTGVTNNNGRVLLELTNEFIEGE